jgi:hypothetical protein
MDNEEQHTSQKSRIHQINLELLIDQSIELVFLLLHVFSRTTDPAIVEAR